MQDSISQLKVSLTHALDFLKTQFNQLQTGRASPALVDHIDIEAYGAKSPLKNMANISIPEARSIMIQPWDKNLLSVIEKAIQMSQLHVNPMNDGVCIRLNLPPLTEERRKELVKIVHKMAEEARITVRQEREKIHKAIKEKEKNKEISEDDMRHGEKRLQEIVDEFNHKIDEMRSHKETDIMTV